MPSTPALAALSCTITKMCRAKCETPLKTLSNMKISVPFATLALKVKKSRHSTFLYLCKKLLYFSCYGEQTIVIIIIVIMKQ